MSTSQTEPLTTGTPRVRVPEDISASKTKLVYIYVATQVETTVEDICASLNLRRLGVAPLLSTLCERGHLVREGDRVRVGT